MDAGFNHKSDYRWGIALIVIAKTGTLSLFGQLPGDIRIDRDGFQLYSPVASMISISVELSALAAVVCGFIRSEVDDGVRLIRRGLSHASSPFRHWLRSINFDALSVLL